MSEMRLRCRLFHNWKPRAYWPGWHRKTCHHCAHLRPPTPPE